MFRNGGAEQVNVTALEAETCSGEVLPLCKECIYVKSVLTLEPL